MTPLRMVILTRPDNTSLYIAADLIGVIEELMPTEHAPALTRVKLRDHTYYDVLERHSLVDDLYAETLPDHHLASGKDAT